MWAESVAAWIYRRGTLGKWKLFGNSGVESKLMQLYPGKTGMELVEKYYIKKLKTTIYILIIGLFFSGCAVASSCAEREMDEKGIPRKEEEEEWVLLGDDGEQIREYPVQIQPKMWTEEEIQEYRDQWRDDIGKAMLGDNVNCDMISSKLFLKESYDQIPWTISWWSDAPDVVEEDGTVAVVEEEIVVSLCAELTYGEVHDNYVYILTVIPPEMEDDTILYQQMLGELQAAEENSRGEDFFTLPVSLAGRQMNWSRQADQNGGIILMLTLATVIASYFLADRDISKQIVERRNKLLLEYPNIVQKLTLLTGAGMSIRGAFLKIGDDYQRLLQEKKGKVVMAYEEIVYLCRELQTGVTDGVAYEHYARRCGLQEYIRLCTILSQNTKRGNRELLNRLREESDKACRESLLRTKKLGEEAGTKLLFPMVGMLAVILIVIMIPAFEIM